MLFWVGINTCPSITGLYAMLMCNEKELIGMLYIIIFVNSIYEIEDCFVEENPFCTVVSSQLFMFHTLY